MRLRQVLFNLSSDAYKFTKEGEVTRARMPALNKYVRCEGRPAVPSGGLLITKLRHFAPSPAPPRLHRFNR
jgi:hypothetical protein